MDVVALGLAKADAKKNYLPNYQPERGFGSLMTKLQGGQSNATMAVLGDSTGDGTNRWVFLVASQLATLFPAYTVRYRHWNDTNLNYDPIGSGGSQTIQTGPNPAAITDNFTRADSSSLGNAANGFPWGVAVGSWSIVSNTAQPQAVNSLATLSVGYADHSGSVTVTLPTSKGAYTSANARVYLRTSSDQGYAVMAELYIADGGANFILNKIVGGVVTAIAHDATVGFAYGGTYTLTWTIVGTSLSASCNGKTLTANLDPIADDLKLLNGPTVGIAAANNYVGMAFSALTVNPTAPTLDVYNASVTGQVSAHSVTYMAQQVPAHMDQILLSYGHNEKSSDCRAAVYAPIRDVREYHPRTQLAVVLQNPRSPVTTAQYAYLRGEGLAKQAQIAALAAQEGVAVVNVYQRFLQVPNYWTTLLNSDGLHPSDGTPGVPTSGGSPLWADEVMRFLATAPIIPQPGGTIRESRKFFASPGFSIAEGSPALALVNGSPAFQMPTGSQTSVVAVCDIPGSWAAFNLYVIWDTAGASGFTGSNNTVKWELLVGSLLQPTGKTVPITSGNDTVGPVALSSLGVVNGSVGNNGIAYTPHATSFTSWQTLTMPGRPLIVQVRRATGDTLADFANLRGIHIERAA